MKSIVEKQRHLLQFNSNLKKMQISNSTSVTTSIAKLKKIIIIIKNEGPWAFALTITEGILKPQVL